MKILVTGAKGFIGSSLCQKLAERGDDVVRLARKNSSNIDPADLVWDYSSEQIDSTQIEGFDVIIHLAGENILGRWSKNKKHNIYSSRIESTNFLARTISQLENKPKMFITASAVGFYGNSGEEIVDEQASPGNSFLSGVCYDWEQACKPAIDAGVKVSNLRISMVLGKSGGPLALMRPIFKLGLGGKLGSGKQYMAWVTLEDLIKAIIFVLDNYISGPVNICSPNPVSNLEFTRAMSQAVKRPVIFPVPAFALKLLFGSMADEVLLSSTRAIPQRLLDEGFEFGEPKIREALSGLI